jgi:AcrR family transcriptional regulator
LQEATQVLAAHGLAGFNTNAMAERAGTSIGTLYQYFSNKAGAAQMIRWLRTNGLDIRFESGRGPLRNAMSGASLTGEAQALEDNSMISKSHLEIGRVIANRKVIHGVAINLIRG